MWPGLIYKFKVSDIFPVQKKESLKGRDARPTEFPLDVIVAN